MDQQVQNNAETAVEAVNENGGILNITIDEFKNDELQLKGLKITGRLIVSNEGATVYMSTMDKILSNFLESKLCGALTSAVQKNVELQEKRFEMDLEENKARIRRMDSETSMNEARTRSYDAESEKSRAETEEWKAKMEKDKAETEKIIAETRSLTSK